MPRKPAKRHLVPTHDSARTWCTMGSGSVFTTSLPSEATCQGCLKAYWRTIVPNPTDIMDLLVAIAPAGASALTPTQRALLEQLTGNKLPNA
jgi:hypothetical protein